MTPSHPAPLATAVNHGVYVLPPGERSGNQYLYTSPCEEVLQKPSEQLMRERGAVFMQGETCFCDRSYNFFARLDGSLGRVWDWK